MVVSSAATPAVGVRTGLGPPFRVRTAGERDAVWDDGDAAVGESSPRAVWSVPLDGEALQPDRGVRGDTPAARPPGGDLPPSANDAGVAAAAAGDAGGDGGGGGAAGDRWPAPAGDVIRVDRSRVALDLDALYEEATSGVGRRLPNGIVNDLRHGTCPYPTCRRDFTSRGALAAHLLATRQHDVHLCCGRPFVSAAALAQHTRDSQTGVHEVAQFYVEPPTAAW